MKSTIFAVVLFLYILSIAHTFFFSHRPYKKQDRRPTILQLTPEEKEKLSKATDDVGKLIGSLNPMDWYKMSVSNQIIANLRRKEDDERKARVDEARKVYINILADNGDEDFYSLREVNRAIFQQWNIDNKFLYLDDKVTSFDELIPGESYDYAHVRNSHHAILMFLPIKRQMSKQGTA